MATGPNFPGHPGELLRELLADCGMTQAQLAYQIGRPYQTVNEIINCKKMITAETAVQLERVLGVTADFWVRADAEYRLSLARAKARERKRRSRDSSSS